ncbi:hypothetical protein D3C78_1451270 [compost metagenome]
MNLGRAIRALDLDMLEPQVGGHQTGLAGTGLPPEECPGPQGQQQAQADDFQDALREPYRLLDTTQAVHAAAAGIAAGELVEVADQRRLIHPQQLGIGTHIAPGKGMARQLVESASLQLMQGLLGQMELCRHLGQRPAPTLASLAQGIARIDTTRRYCFGMRRLHHCSDRYC